MNDYLIFVKRDRHSTDLIWKKKALVRKEMGNLSKEKGTYQIFIGAFIRCAKRNFGK